MASPSKDIPEFELIRRMAHHGPDSSEARAAWSVFYTRHYRFVARVCTHRHGYLLGLAAVNDLVQDTFINAFNGARTFDHEEECGALEQELKCHGWLVAIAHNLVRDRYRGQPEVLLIDDADLELAGVPDRNPDQIPAPESERLRLVKSGFCLLSEANKLCFGQRCSGGKPTGNTSECLNRQCGNSRKKLANRPTRFGRCGCGD